MPSVLEWSGKLHVSRLHPFGALPLRPLPRGQLAYLEGLIGTIRFTDYHSIRVVEPHVSRKSDANLRVRIEWLTSMFLPSQETGPRSSILRLGRHLSSVFH